MFRKLLLSASLLALTAGSISLGWPKYIENKAQSALKDLGLPEWEISKSGLNYVQFENVSLDQDGISLIKNLTITFKPFDFASQQLIDFILIEEADFIASYKDEGIILDGFSAGNTKLNQANNVAFKNSEITILTDNYGAITIEGDLLIEKNNETHNLQTQFSSRQKQLSLSGQGTGSWSNGNLSLALEFDRGKFELPDFNTRMTRMNGKATINYNNSSFDVLANMRAGGLKTAELPWQNASLTYEQDTSGASAFLSGKSIGIEGVELAANYNNGTFEAELYGQDEDAIGRYLTRLNLSAEELKFGDYMVHSTQEPSYLKLVLKTKVKAQ